MACLLGVMALLCQGCGRSQPPAATTPAARPQAKGLAMIPPQRAYQQPTAAMPVAYNPPAPPPPSQTMGASSSASETIAAGDLIQVDVEGQAKYSGQVQVAGSGAAFYSLGLVPGVAGMGTGQLAVELERRYKIRDLRDPHVTVTIREHALRRIYVAGCVQRPGVVQLTFGSTTTVLRAIAEAGGFTDDANRQAICVLRDGRVQSVAGEAMILREPTRDLVLRADDQVIIPPLDRIYVSGEVVRGGPLIPPSGEPLTLTRALSMAGGLGRYASHDIVLMRGTERIAVDLDSVLSGGVADPALRPGDALFVPQRRF